ncbi:MAG: DUF6781 family protein [Planctomycetota bacterium]
MNPEAQTESIVDDGNDIKDRVRRLTRDTIAAGMASTQKGTDQLADLAGRVFAAAGAAVERKDEGDDAKRSALNDVVDGFSAGLNEAVDATRQTLQGARDRGEKFAREDIAKSVDDLESIRKSMVDAVQGMTASVSGMMGEEAAALKDRIAKAGEQIKPNVEQATKAAREHPGELANEAVVSVVRAGAAAVGIFGEAVSGALNGVGDALADRDKPKAAGDAADEDDASSKQGG